jgi:hypothetical protein
MTEHHVYSADAWSTIAQHVPSTGPDKLNVVRRQLETAAEAYLRDRSIKSDMADAKGKRDNWRRLLSAASNLTKAINALDEWHPPTWGVDAQPELERQGSRERELWLQELETLSNMADENFWECDRFVKGSSAEARLSSEILRIWTDDLHQKLGFTRREKKVVGPLWNFFRAVALPVLGDKTPKPETFAKIVKREKTVRGQAVRSGDGKARPKKRLTLPSPMVP